MRELIIKKQKDLNNDLTILAVQAHGAGAAKKYFRFLKNSVDIVPS